MSDIVSMDPLPTRWSGSGLDDLVPILVIVSTISGFFVGSFLHQIALRMAAPASTIVPGRCASCGVLFTPWNGVPIISWLVLGGRCASCRARIPPLRPLVEALTGAAFGVIAWWFLRNDSADTRSWAEGWALVLVIVAFLYFAAISIVLALIDVKTHRLPNSIVLPSYLVAGGLFTATAALTDQWAELWRAAIGMGMLYAFYLVLRMVGQVEWAVATSSSPESSVCT